MVVALFHHIKILFRCGLVANINGILCAVCVVGDCDGIVKPVALLGFLVCRTEIFAGSQRCAVGAECCNIIGVDPDVGGIDCLPFGAVIRFYSVVQLRRVQIQLDDIVGIKGG